MALLKEISSFVRVKFILIWNCCKAHLKHSKNVPELSRSLATELGVVCDTTDHHEQDLGDDRMRQGPVSNSPNLALTSFHKLRDLPPELRLDILQKASQMDDGRIVEVCITGPVMAKRPRRHRAAWFNQNIHLTASPRTPQPRHISGACWEGRIAVLDTHNIRFGRQPLSSYRANYSGSLCHNFDRDILYISNLTINPTRIVKDYMRILISAMPAAIIPKIRVLAINCKWDFHSIPAEIEKFPNLELLILITGLEISPEAPSHRQVLKDMTLCEHWGCEEKLRKSDVLQRWIKARTDEDKNNNNNDGSGNDKDNETENENENENDGTSRPIRSKRMIWLAYDGYDGSDSHCRCGARFGGIVNHRQSITILPGQRQTLEFSESSRGPYWW